MKKSILLAATAIVSISAHAQTYGEIGYSALQFSASDTGDTFKASPGAVRGIAGYEIAPNLAVEGMLATGMGNSDVKLNGKKIDSKLEVGYVFGFYVKPKAKLNEAVDVFGRLGYARATWTETESVNGQFESGSNSSFSFGAGLSYAINPKMSVTADYMQYVKKDGGKLSGLTFGAGLKF